MSSLYEQATGDTNGGGTGTATAPATTPVSNDNPFAASSTNAPASTPTSTQSQTPPAASAAQTASTAPAGQVPPTQAAQQTPPAQQQLTTEQIADIAAQAAARVGQQTTQQAAAQGQQQQRPQMSQEEFNKAFNVVQLTDKDFATITGYVPDKPEQVAALNTFAQNIVKQALTMAQVHIQSVTQSLEQRFGQQVAPLTQQREAQVGAQLKSEFFQTHTDLKDLDALVEEVANNVKASGRTFADKESAFKFVADKVRLLVPNRAPVTSQQQTGATASNQGQQVVTRQMTPTSVGGQAGASGGSATAPITDAKSIFG